MFPYRLPDVICVEGLRRTFNAPPYNSTIYTKKSPRHHLGDDAYTFDTTTEEYR